VEEGTPLDTLVRTGRIANVDPDVQADRYDTAVAVLGAAGYLRYEVSNFAKRARASRHNLLYWCAGDYLGFGAGAHGHLDGTRWWNVRLPREFIAQADDPIAGSEHLDGPERVREALMLGLRLRSGVDLDGLAEKYGSDEVVALVPALKTLEREGLVERFGPGIRIPERWVFLTNEVLCRLLGKPKTDNPSDDGFASPKYPARKAAHRSGAQP
jgi:coproporphyrinogen III oxidase-like Fe-S oxidoreductase